MTRDVAFEVYAPPKRQLFAASSSDSKSGLLGINDDKCDKAPQLPRVINDGNAVPLGELNGSSFFFAVPDIEATEDQDDKRSESKNKRRTHQKSRREEVIDSLRGHAPNLVLAHWQLPGKNESNFANGRDGFRRWTSSLFNRRSHMTPGGICFSAREPLHALTRAWRRGYCWW